VLGIEKSCEVRGQYECRQPHARVGLPFLLSSFLFNFVPVHSYLTFSVFISTSVWLVKSLCRPGPLVTVARQLASYMLYLMGVREVRWDKGSTVRVEDYTFF
jgi:hypothetical protein